MKVKKIVIFLLITALILVLTPYSIYAAKSPTVKTKGEIEIIPINTSDSSTGIVEFNARGAKNGILGKGLVLWTQTDGTVTLYHEVVIDTVEVDGNVATFSGEATISSTELPGTMFYFRVTDGDPDLLEFSLDGASWSGYNVVNGNIVVSGVTKTNVSETDPDDLDGLSKAEILMASLVPGLGLATAPGLQKKFNPNSQASKHAGKKDSSLETTGEETDLEEEDENDDEKGIGKGKYKEKSNNGKKNK